MEPILTDADRAFFAEQGYVRVKGIVPGENCASVIDMLYDFLGFNRNDPEGWYREPLRRGGMCEIYQHQALWNNRQHPRIHQVFSELLGTEKLLVSFDRANFNPPVHPAHPEYDHPGMIHWDIDPATAHTAPFGVQGVLYLDNTPVERGGFCCVPGHHRTITHWAATGESVPGAPSTGGRTPANKSEVEIVPITGEAGDLVIWDRRLLHGNGRNLSDRPRLAQYITMWETDRMNDEQLADRVMRWEKRLPPNADWAPGDPRRAEELYGTTATLTPLGERLLGKTRWG
jgi:hypothetical protein